VIKTAEQEVQLKLAIRDVVARNPIITVVQLQNTLRERGFHTANGNPLDWRYVSKMLRKLNREKSLAIDQQKIQDRLAITKERYRVIIERLWKIIDYRMEYLDDHIRPPTNDEIVRAANTVVKLDLAILKAEMDAGIFDRKLGSVDVNIYRAAPLDPGKAALIAGAFKRWGIDLTLPTNERPTQIQPVPLGDAPANDSPTAVSA
jgi:hypothetical protein